MKKILYFLTISLLTTSCQSNNGNEKAPLKNDEKNTAATTPITTKRLKPEQLYGEWSNVSMIITTAYNTPESTKEEYKEENWEKDLKMKPVRTYYHPDGTYSSKYHYLDGLVDTTSGIWKIKQDSVILRQSKPKKRSATYHVKFQNKNAATFTALLDWTNNGKEDDLYVGKQQRISNE